VSAVDLRTRLRELARFESAGSPVVSVYLNTEWVDEHQRERARIFVKNALAEARGRRWADGDDLDWIERQGKTLVERAAFEGANGAVLFACGSANLRELFPLRVAFDDTFVVDARPYVRPLAGILDDTPPSLVVFVDGASARLIALDATGVSDETVLQAEVPATRPEAGPRSPSPVTSVTCSSTASSTLRRWRPPSAPGPTVTTLITSCWRRSRGRPPRYASTCRTPSRRGSPGWSPGRATRV